jgi:hypothetical protein
VSVKVTLLDRDVILGAILRALAVQVAGFQVVGGMNREYLEQNGYYRFPFSQVQFVKFQMLVKDYVPARFQLLIRMAEERI